MTNGFLQTIRELLAEEDTPPRVSNRILFGALQEIYHRMNQSDQFREELIEKVDALYQKINALEWRMEKIEERDRQAPSLTWLLQNKPGDTIKWILFIIALIIILLALSEPLRMLFQRIAGGIP